MTTPAATKIVRCCHCRGMMKVTARALSVFCPHCQTRVTLEDLRIIGSHPGKRLATAGDILVEASARLNLELIGSRVLIRGRVKGLVQASEYVEIASTGQVVGDIRAPKLVVREGGVVQGRFEHLATTQHPALNKHPEAPAAGVDEADGAHTEKNAPAPDDVPPPPRLQPRPLRLPTS